MPKEGDRAPEFTVQTDARTTVTLSDYRGKWVILFFYPRDDTPGCTIEVCSFRDHAPDLEKLDAVALGVSPDDPDSHVKFKTKFGLPMTLLADEDHAIANAYGVWVEKNMFGAKRMGVARTTFLIDPDGKVARVFEKVDPSGHAQDVASVIKQLRK